MSYNPEDLARLKHLYELGDQILNLFDDEASRLDTLIGEVDGSILYGTKEYWSQQLGFIPKKGAIIIYTDYTKQYSGETTVDVPNFKVGDGKAYVVDLPFSNDDLRMAIRTHLEDASIHLSEDDRDKLENSVKTSIKTQSGSSDYTLVFSKD